MPNCIAWVSQSRTSVSHGPSRWRRGCGIEPPMRVLQIHALPLGYRAFSWRSRSASDRTALYLIPQNDRLSDFFDGSPVLPALALQSKVRLLFGQSEFPLQGTFPTFQQFRYFVGNPHSAAMDR